MNKSGVLGVTEVNCNGSLAYGDIGFGDGELNWKCYILGNNRLNTIDNSHKLQKCKD